MDRSGNAQPSELPSGTITFLFTDVERSTSLWDREPESMRRALARHDALLHELVSSHNGHVVKGTGDGVLAAFSSAAHAVRAAIAGQRALSAEPWESSEPLNVRMGIDTGEAELRGRDYFGSTVNRAARVMAAAHGGQIVCTGVSEQLLRDEFDLVDLGEYRLDGLVSPAHLFQVEVPGASRRFPPLRSPDVVRSNLPPESSSFIGRDEAVRSVTSRLSESRVVSIVGVGGVGKTRLALRVGRELVSQYPDGVWLCELAPVAEPDALYDAIAAAIGHVAPQGTALVDSLPQFLERKRTLLILDNCEHLVSTVAQFVTFASTHAAKVSVLTTSREALGVNGEHVVPLHPLHLPEGDDPESVLDSEAGILFVARVREKRGELTMSAENAQAVEALCRRLDGIPLAIELAAGQAAVMTPAEINARLDHEFRLLSGRRASLERHRTLRAAIAWSFDLLDDAERELLARLSVCVGGFGIDAVEPLAAGIDDDELDALDLLGSLVAKSLVERTEHDGVTRYRMLEMIRQYATDQLRDSDPAESARDTHAHHFLTLACELFHDARTGHDYQALERLKLETANITAGARWLLSSERVPELMEFFEGLPFLNLYALPVATLDELGAVADEVIDRADVASSPGFAYACLLAGGRAETNGDAERRSAIAALTAQFGTDPQATTIKHFIDATLALYTGDVDQAVDAAEHAVAAARLYGDAAWLSGNLAHCAIMTALQTRRDRNVGDAALSLADEAFTTARRTGSSVALLYPTVAIAAANQEHDPARALEAADELVRIDRTQRQWWASIGRDLATAMRIQGGDLVGGLTQWKEVARAHDRDGQRHLLSVQIAQLAGMLAPTDQSLAIELAAIAEGGAIARVAAFTVHPELISLMKQDEALVNEAHAATATMSYDDAIDRVFAIVDQAVANHASS